jgi:hypothetical protein
VLYFVSMYQQCRENCVKKPAVIWMRRAIPGIP